MDLDKQLLSKIFSTEVWMLVFNSLIEKEDYAAVQNSVNSSLHFRTILWTKLTTVLFPKVFENLATKYENKPSDTYREEPWKISDVESKEYYKNNPFGGRLPRGIYEIEDKLKAPTLKKKKRRIYGKMEYPAENVTVLKLRLVCKTWNKGVNQFYQTLPQHFKMNHDSNSKNSRKFEGKSEIWSMEQFISKKFQTTVSFLSHFDSTHATSNVSRNPFIGRAIAIKELPSTSGDWYYMEKPLSAKDRVFWKTITNILETYGEHIWYCEISYRNKFLSLVKYYRQMKEWISLMPNLRVLYVSYPMKMYKPTFPTKRELEQIQREIINNPLPKLENLEFLKTFKIPAPLLNELITQNSNRLEMLQIGKDQIQNDYINWLDTVQFHKLKELSLQICTKAEFTLLLNSSVNWNLEKLYLDYDRAAEFIEWPKVFKFVEGNCADKVNSLMISLPVAKSEEYKEKLLSEAVSYRLNMPSVKRLKLVISNQVPIDFILPMKNCLVVLEFYFEYKLWSKKSDQTIHFVGYENKWMESNIWELFPKLKRVHVYSINQYQSYVNRSMATREGWEKKNNKGNVQTSHVSSKHTRALRSNKNMQPKH